MTVEMTKQSDNAYQVDVEHQHEIHDDGIRFAGYVFEQLFGPGHYLSHIQAGRSSMDYTPIDFNALARRALIEGMTDDDLSLLNAPFMRSDAARVAVSLDPNASTVTDGVKLFKALHRASTNPTTITDSAQLFHCVSEGIRDNQAAITRRLMEGIFAEMNLIGRRHLEAPRVTLDVPYQFTTHNSQSGLTFIGLDVKAMANRIRVTSLGRNLDTGRWLNRMLLVIDASGQLVDVKLLDNTTSMLSFHYFDH